MLEPTLLTTPEQVAALAGRLASERVIAIDLEADSMHSYQEKICLLQITTARETVLIDPLPLEDLDVLAPVLADPTVRKIFHAADYDLRCLARDYRLTVSGLFDTMICAQLAGEERIGLADLLARYFGVELDKRFQRANWAQRPLSAEMLAYAAEDTRHLHRLADLMESRLHELGRWSWAVEEFQLLEGVRFTEPEGPLCLRVKGTGRLARRQLGILEELLQWRDAEARRRDRPHFKVIGNPALLALATACPQTMRGLIATEGISPRHADRYGKALLAAIRRGQERPDSDLPSLPRQPRRQRDPELDQRLAALKEWRQAKAAELALDPGVLINNALLTEIARARPRTPEELATLPGIKQWQVRAFGEELAGS